MKITTLDAVLKDIDGNDAKDGQFPFTLRRAIRGALGNHVPSDAGASAEDKERCFDLMIAAGEANGEWEIKSEDATLIKSRVSQMYPPWAAGQAAKMIEGS